MFKTIREDLPRMSSNWGMSYLAHTLMAQGFFY